MLSQAVECAAAIAAAVPPASTLPMPEDIKWLEQQQEGAYDPKPVDTSEQVITTEMECVVEDLALRSHEQWAYDKLRAGWKHAAKRDDAQKLHPLLKPYDELAEADKEANRVGCRETIKVIKALGWDFHNQGRQLKRAGTARGGTSPSQWSPSPINLSGVRLNADVLAMSERLAENSHDVWAVGKMKALAGTGQTHPDLIPYDKLTDAQKQYDRKASTDTLKYLTMCGYTLIKRPRRRGFSPEHRFGLFVLRMCRNFLLDCG